MEVMVVLYLFFCGVAAYIASNKGRSGGGIFCLSLFLSPLVGIIVAVVMHSDPRTVALKRGMKQCPACAEYVQPEAKICRFCQRSFVEEEPAAQALREAEAARQQAEYEAQRAAEAAKPWPRRNAGTLAAVLIPVAFLVVSITLIVWYSSKYQPVSTKAASEIKPVPIPAKIVAVRSKVPNSVWDNKVAWATQHHCYFAGMSRNEIVQAVGAPTVETQFSLTYKRQTKNCFRYDGDVCAEFKTEENTVFLANGYTDPQFINGDDCYTLYGQHEYWGLTVPHNPRMGRRAKNRITANDLKPQAHPITAENLCETLRAACAGDDLSPNCTAYKAQCSSPQQ